MQNDDKQRSPLPLVYIKVVEWFGFSKWKSRAGDHTRVSFFVIFIQTSVFDQTHRTRHEFFLSPDTKTNSFML